MIEAYPGTTEKQPYTSIKSYETQQVGKIPTRQSWQPRDWKRKDMMNATYESDYQTATSLITEVNLKDQATQSS